MCTCCHIVRYIHLCCSYLPYLIASHKNFSAQLMTSHGQGSCKTENYFDESQNCYITSMHYDKIAAVQSEQYRGGTSVNTVAHGHAVNVGKLGVQQGVSQPQLLHICDLPTVSQSNPHTSLSNKLIRHITLDVHSHINSAILNLFGFCTPY